MKDLKRFQLFKYVPKTFQIDVGNMYLPFRFHFTEMDGEFTAYFSFKERFPNEENGYEQKNVMQPQCVFPKTHEYARAGVQRLPKKKTLYMTLESNANCHVSISMTQNRKVDDLEVYHYHEEEPSKPEDVAASSVASASS